MAINRYVQFAGGMNTQVNQFIMRDDECNLLKNVTLETIGSVQKCLGYTQRGAKLGVADTDILGLIDYNQSSGTRSQIAAYGGKMFKYNTGTTNWDDQSLTLTAGARYEFETFLDQLFAVNGTDANYSYNGSAWSSSSVYVAGSPICAYIKRYHDALYVAGNSSKKSRVWKSDSPIGAKLTWGWVTGSDGANSAATVFTSASGKFKTYNVKIGDMLRITSGPNIGEYVIKSVDSDTQLTLADALPDTSESSQSYEAGSNWFSVGEDDGDVIKGFGENSDRLLVFKEFSVWAWDGTSVIRIGDVGTPSQRTVVNIDTWTIFANRKGVYAWDGQQIRLLSRKMQKFIDAIDQNEVANMVGWAEGNLYNLYIGAVTVDGRTHSNVVLVYDVTQNNWWFRSIADAVRVASKFIESGQVKYFIGNSVGKVYQWNYGNTYSGTAIEMEIQTKDYDFTKPEDFKEINEMIAFCDQAEGTQVMMMLDKGDPTPIGSLQRYTTRIDIPLLKGRRARLIYMHNDSNSRPTIEGHSFYWESKGEKG